ncbi:MAG TPA: hypothetical protein VM406_05680, partial [Noviherbaspirillum sp.]|nr:hypothetical protein [Noviherbaspirillum sp.]
MTRTTFATSLTSPTCSIIASRHPVNALMLSTCLLLSGCGADNAGTGQVDSNNSILPFSMESISLEDESTGVVRAVAPRFAFTNEPDATAIAANVQLTHAHGSAALSFGVDKT